MNQQVPLIYFILFGDGAADAGDGGGAADAGDRAADAGNGGCPDAESLHILKCVIRLSRLIKVDEQ